MHTMILVFVAEDGCDEFVDDSAEFQRKWIWKMQEKGMCACDEEHMFHCPKDDNTINTEKGTMEKDNLDQVLNSLLGEKSNVSRKRSRVSYIWLNIKDSLFTLR